MRKPMTEAEAHDLEMAEVMAYHEWEMALYGYEMEVADLEAEIHDLEMAKARAKHKLKIAMAVLRALEPKE